jgi:rRNA maturation endonuclease Nob1
MIERKYPIKKAIRSKVCHRCKKDFYGSKSAEICPYCDTSAKRGNRIQQYQKMLADQAYKINNIYQ